jgi:two-component system response regulator ChvI
MPHLLLVDDDDLFRESLGLNLVDEGYEVTCFGNGQDALAYLNHGKADAMLLDWRMPNLSGIEVLRRMRDPTISMKRRRSKGARSISSTKRAACRFC